jgi:hypothetical protein
MTPAPIVLKHPRCAVCENAGECYFPEHDYRDSPRLRHIRWHSAEATQQTINPLDTERPVYDFR